MNRNDHEFAPPPPTKDQVVHGLSDDLRRYVEMILGCSALMLSDMDAADPLRQYAERVLAAAKYADDRVAHLVRISQDPLEPSKSGKHSEGRRIRSELSSRAWWNW